MNHSIQFMHLYQGDKNLVELLIAIGAWLWDFIPHHNPQFPLFFFLLPHMYRPIK